MINAFVLIVAVILGGIIGYIIFLIKKHGLKILGKQIVENPYTKINKVLNDPELLYKKLSKDEIKYLNHGREFKIQLVENKKTGKKEVQIEEGTMRKTLKAKETVGVLPSKPVKKITKKSEGKK